MSFYVEEMLSDGSFVRCAQSHSWEKLEDAHKQREELAVRSHRIFACLVKAEPTKVKDV